MRLKSIKLAGFKSFVDSTKVDLPRTITAVVGPNGCGKSNIIDAVRWVMGEISAKQLRGESMSDVIFNGSSKRAPLGQAAIELHFDNTFGRLGGEYNTYHEITIRRQVSRDGQSNYYLNGTRCRRKDITDVFLGTGLGARSYAIIEQGTISRLIEAKPEEFRVFLEEAAGISRYKERRKETEQRLGHTHENLARINDLREELYKQIAHLERQAKTAEKYKEMKAQARTLRAQLFVLRYQHLQKDLETTKLSLDKLSANIHQDETAYTELTENLQSQFSAQSTAQKNLEEAQHQFSELNAEIRLKEQNIRHNQEQQRQFESELKQTLQQQNETEHLSTLDHSSLEKLSSDLTEIQKNIQEMEALLHTRKTSHQEASAAQRTWQSQWQEHQLNISDHSKIAQVEQTKLQQIEARLQQLKQQSEKLAQEKLQLDASAEKNQLTQTSEALQQAGEARANAKATLEKQESELQTLRQNLQAQNKALNETRQALQQLEGKLSALDTLQQIALGRQQQSLQPWLKTHGLDQSERLANVIEVEPGYEIYLENYLGEKLQAIAIENIDRLNFSSDALPEGNIDFVWHGSNTNTSEAPGETLISKIKGPKSLLQKLSHVYFASTAQEALALLPSLPENAEVITQEGVLVQQGWIQIRRSKTEQGGLLQRKREIAELENQLHEKRSTLETLEQKQKTEEENLLAAEVLRKQLLEDNQKLDQQWNQQQAQVQIQRSRIEQKEQRLSDVEQELAQQSSEMERLNQDYQSARETWQNALDALNTFNQSKDSLASQQEAIEAKLLEANQHLRDADDSLQQLRMKEQRYSAEHQGLLSQQERTSNQQQQLAQRKTFLEEQLTKLTPNTEALEKSLLEFKEKLQAQELVLEVARTALSDIEQKLRQIEHERQLVSQNLDGLREALTQHQVKVENLQTKSSNILEQFQTLDCVFDEVAGQIPEDAQESMMEPQLAELDQRIERLGAVNLAAMSELEGLAERKTFIDTQYQDLTEAVTALEAAIREIDLETKSKFEETFNTVNQNFQSLFPKIFGGGNAYLSLTSDDLLESGVAVFAQPPGKRNSSIHLLSGGEKALTALALVFGIFELNPAPFCMLDEVDAPLDDVNVGRFCNLVKAMSGKTQFIVVTHNKVAMEMADQLMGITMHEPGVSRLVSVDIEAAIAMAAQGS